MDEAEGDGGVVGLMQARAMTVSSIIDHAARHHGSREIVGRGHDGVWVRSDWRGVRERAGRVASALTEMGLGQGERVATLAWNRLPHLELYFGVTGAGLVLHTVNPRLHADHLVYILNHGAARVLCVEPDLLHLVTPILERLTTIETVIVLCAEAHLPEGGVAGQVAYEAWIGAADSLAQWPDIDELAASTLCYTSGTTGDPKGVLYSHRSTVLHAMQACTADSMALSARDSIALVTPLFHVNAWGVPFAAAMCGAKLALPGSALDPASLLNLMSEERATFALGVPTVWLGVMDHLAGLPESQRPSLALTRVFIGGSAPPASLIKAFRNRLGVEVVQAWGMTETSPVMTVNRPLAHHASLSADETVRLQSLQGRAVFGADMRIVSDDDVVLANDGAATGRLQARGLWVIARYFGAEQAAADPEGWFDTGDIAQITADGFLRLTDRSKDVIKSGGEWISSIDLENAAQAFPDVAEAAVIGAAHPRWQERPLMLVQMRPGRSLDRDALMAHLAERVARWWLPDDILAVEDLPHSATGKLLKYALRETYGDHFVSAEAH